MTPPRELRDCRVSVISLGDGDPCSGYDPARQARPLHLPKPVRHPIIVIKRLVDHDRQQESLVGRYQVGPIDRELPFKTEIPLDAIVRVPGDDREEKGAGLDLLADRLVPGVPASQLALVEPDFAARGTEGFADMAGCLRVLRGVAQEHCLARVGHSDWPLITVRGDMLCYRMVVVLSDCQITAA